MELKTEAKKILKCIGEKGERVLIIIEGISSNQTLKEFVSMFQIYMRQDLPVFLVLAGLAENVFELQDEKTITFLYRAPKIEV